jgi:hypothetical protein
MLTRPLLQRSKHRPNIRLREFSTFVERTVLAAPVNREKVDICSAFM